MLNKDTLQTQLISRRTFIIGAGKFGLLFLLAGRMFYMQFLKKDEYKTLSDKNRIKLIIVAPVRGQIYDAAKNAIAKNISCFRLFLDKNYNPDFINELNLIIDLLELDDNQGKEIINRVKKESRRIPTIIIDHLDWYQIAAIEERKLEFKSIFIDTGYTRFYKMGAITCHILGYMGRNTEKDQAPAINFARENFKIGKNGIELFYEKTLQGQYGFKQIEVNAHGKYVRALKNKDSIYGADLHLNIDANLQRQILPYLNQNSSSAIVMDCTNGAILSLISLPNFDPNNFTNLSNKYWQSLINDPNRPLVNKAVQGLYPPGSIFKIITILAALEAGISPDYQIHCDGSSMLGGNRFRCASTRGHGTLDMIKAIQYSCNSYIFKVARLIGADNIINMAKKFGLNEKTGIDLPEEMSGFIPTKIWKKQKLATPWTLGDTLNLSIGQGFSLVTPLQLVRLIAAIASDGKLFTPQIAVNTPNFTQIDINQNHLNILKTALYKTINNPGGTGYLHRLDYKNWQMAGKTGTAQVQAKKNAQDDLSKVSVAWHRRNHAIFTGFAPFNAPKYAVCVYLDHGGSGGSAAAPVAKKIMTHVLERYS